LTGASLLDEPPIAIDLSMLERHRGAGVEDQAGHRAAHGMILGFLL
jgi:hypothetical protein